MAAFGGFETVREIARNGPVVLYAARPLGAPAPAAGAPEPNVIKSIEPAVHIIGHDQARQAAASFLDAASVQEQLAPSGRWAPIIKAEAAGDGVVFRVADDGPGMDAATLSQAFTPFFSHRPAGRGRGMGLSRARRRVQANGGQMWIDSAPGRGTTVHVKLPQAPPEGPSHE